MGSFGAGAPRGAVVLKTNLDLQVQIMNGFNHFPSDTSFTMSENGASIYYSELNNNRIHEISTIDLTFSSLIEIAG